MPLFRIVCALFVCPEKCGVDREVITGIHTTILHWGLAGVGALIWYVGKLSSWVPWYYLIALYCAELLLLYGLAVMRFLLCTIIVNVKAPVCPHCGGALSVNGHYYRDLPRGTSAAWLSFFQTLLCFAAANAAVWYVWGDGLS